MNGWGERVSGCGFCVHADSENMKCYPDSDDCKREYDLKEADFNGPCDCDFYKRKEK